MAGHDVLQIVQCMQRLDNLTLVTVNKTFSLAPVLYCAHIMFTMKHKVTRSEPAMQAGSLPLALCARHTVIIGVRFYGHTIWHL